MLHMSRSSLVFVVSLSMAGCGAEPSPEDVEVEPIQQAVTIHDNCITSGEAPNATENPAGGDSYTRQGSLINSGCRDTTIVDINGVGNTKYRIASFATFKNTFSFLCPLAYVHARVMKWSGGAWVQVNSSSDTTVSTWNGTNCFAQVTRILSPSDYSASGDYRVRVRAYRPDGTYETVSVASSVWQ
jgi:hypothetical protein